MKFLVLLALVAVVASAQATTDEQKAKFKEYLEACLTSSKVDKELLGKARKGEYTGRDEKLKAYFHCMTKKMEFQAEDGTFNFEKMVEHLPATVNRENGLKTLKKCGEHQDATPAADRAMDFVFCFYKTLGKEVKLY